MLPVREQSCCRPKLTSKFHLTANVSTTKAQTCNETCDKRSHIDLDPANLWMY